MFPAPAELQQSGPLNRLCEKAAAFRDLNSTKSTHHPAETGSFFKGQNGSVADRSSLLKVGVGCQYIYKEDASFRSGGSLPASSCLWKGELNPRPSGAWMLPSVERLQPFFPEQGQQDPCWDTRSRSHSSGAHHLVVKWIQPPKLFLEWSVHLGLHTGHTHRGRLASEMLLSDVQTD